MNCADDVASVAGHLGSSPERAQELHLGVHGRDDPPEGGRGDRVRRGDPRVDARDVVVGVDERDVELDGQPLAVQQAVRGGIAGRALAERCGRGAPGAEHGSGPGGDVDASPLVQDAHAARRAAQLPAPAALRAGVAAR